MTCLCTSVLLVGLVSGAVGVSLRPGDGVAPAPDVQLNVGTAVRWEDASAAEEQAETALWEGSDSVPEWYMNNLTKASAGDVSFELMKVRRKFPHVQILGMFDSGTNLLVATMHKNFREFAEGFEEQWWKHATPAQNKKNTTSQHLLIQMVRSPLAQITAWTKAGYDLGYCVNDYDLPCNVRGASFPGGVTDVWNTYTQGYDQAAKQDNAMVVEYEALVLDPESVMVRIADKLGTTLPGPVQMVGKPAKNHGQPVGRQSALAKIRDMSYLTAPLLGQSSVRTSVCHRLKAGVMANHEIPTDPKRLYSDDCSQ